MPKGQVKDITGDCWLTSSDVATFFHVSPSTVRLWANKGTLRAQWTLGGHRRFLLSDVERLASNKLSSNSIVESIGFVPKILIIDDDVDVAEALSAILLHHLNEVELHHASDGFEAAVIIQEFIPDLVFLDIVMPGIRGDAVCRFMHQKLHLKHVPIIGMSGCADAETIDQMKSAGALVILDKPFDRIGLLKYVDQSLKINGVKCES